MLKPARHWLLWSGVSLVALAAIATGWFLLHTPSSSRIVRVGIYENAPKIYTDADDQPAGIYVQLLQRISLKEHWSIDYVHCTWKQCLDMLQDGRIDLMPDVGYSVERTRSMDFNHLAVVHGWSQVYAHAGLDIRSIRDLANRRVAVLNKSIQESYFDTLMKDSGMHYTPVPVDTYKDGFQALASGRADAVITNNFYMARHNDDGSVVQTPILFQPVGMYFATVRGQHDDLLNVIDGYLRTWEHDPNSIYFSALHKSLESNPVEVVPKRLIVGLLVTLGMVVVFIVASLILRWKVRQRTADLARTTRHLDEVLQASPAVIYRLREQDGHFVPDWVSPNIQRLFGFTVDEVLTADWWRSQLHPEDAEKAIRRFRKLPEQGSRVHEYRIFDAHGTVRYIRDEMHVAPAHDDQPRTVFGTWSDLTESHAQAERVDFLTYHDALTRLPNRLQLTRSLNQAIELARSGGGMLAVLWIDLDHFKNINDTLGHSIGDAFLTHVAANIRKALEPDDLLSRVGGDEFAVMLARDVGVHHAMTMTERVLSVFVDPMTVQGHTLTLTASIGISMHPSDGKDAETLLRHAEVAMYEAKNRGRNTWCLFDDHLSLRVVERLAMENALRGAVDRNELVLHYQPQIALDSGQPVGIEALVRWNHPDAGLLPPSQFIGLAEDSGVINPIGAWVLGETCRQMMAWRRQGLDVPSISVNLSVRQLEHGNLVTQVAEVLAESGLDAASLELELTESMVMRDPDQATRTLAELKQLGVKLSIDDFGTGHSSLAYLKRLPLDRLKIDRSFVRDIGRDPDDEAISRTVIELSRQLGLAIIAEGVEREEQAAFLKREGCQVVQGYLYSKPLPAEALAAFWSTRKTTPSAAAPSTVWRGLWGVGVSASPAPQPLTASSPWIMAGRDDRHPDQNAPEHVQALRKP